MRNLTSNFSLICVNNNEKQIRGIGHVQSKVSTVSKGNGEMEIVLAFQNEMPLFKYNNNV